MNARVRSTWAYRTAAEYRSACVAAEMLHWSLALGLAPDLVDDVWRLVADERRHADLSREVLTAAGGTDGSATITRDELSLTIGSSETLERRALVAAFQEFAVHETVALEAFRTMRRAKLVPPVLAAVTVVVRDEARHRRVGWRLVEALLVRTGEYAWLRSQVPEALAGVTRAFTRHAPDPSPEEAAWGLIGRAARALVVRRAIDGFVARRMCEIGLFPP